MKRLALSVALAIVSGSALADTEPGIAAIQELGRINGQALACSQMATAGKAKSLMIRHAPKTRRYGEIFEETTSAAFLAQGKDTEHCPQAAEFASRLTEIGTRLQVALPATQ